jgi:O-antigen ligase
MTNIQNSLKWVIISGLFAIPFLGFIVTRSLLFPFITGKGFAFRIIVEIIFACWAYLTVLVPKYRPKFDYITKSILVFLGIVFLADVFSVYSFKSFWSNYERMEGFVLMTHLVAYYLVLRTTMSAESDAKSWWKYLWNTNLVASAIMSVYGIFQLAGKLTINQGGVRIDATFGNASYLAIYMVFSMFVALILAYKESNKMMRYAYGAVFLLDGFILYHTATRGSILGIIGGMILSALLVIWKEKDNKQMRKISSGVLVAVAVFAGVFFLARNTSFVKSSPVLSRFTSFSLSDTENQGRSYVWPMAIKGAMERPILGWGQESFNYVFNKYYNPAMYNQEQWFDRTHDIFLDWLINAGVLGLLAYVSMFISMLYMLWKKSSFSTEEKALITGLIGAYVFHNIFVFDNVVSYILFFSMLAWVSSSSNEESGNKPPKAFSKETADYLIAPVLVVALVSCFYFVNYKPIMASTYLINSITQSPDGIGKNLEYFKQTFAYNSFGSPEALEQLVTVSMQIMSAQFDQKSKEDFFKLADEQIKVQLVKTPKDARYLLLAGSFYNRVGGYDLAIPILTEAVKNSPNKPAMYFELGSSYIGKGDNQKAFEVFTEGYNLEKDSRDSQIIYAIGALYAKKADVFKQMVGIVGQDVLISDGRLLQAYINTKDFASAINILSVRLTMNPSDYNTELQLASIYASIGNNAKAVALIKDVEQKNPSLKDQLDPYIKQLSQ